MKKYTIVYADTKMIGSHMNSITKFDRVETDDLAKLLEEEYDGAIWFVFEGWPKQEGEE